MHGCFVEVTGTALKESAIRSSEVSVLHTANHLTLHKETLAHINAR